MTASNITCHSRSFQHQTENNERKVTIVFVITLITMFAEISVGTWSGSMALLADGWHMGSHAGAFALSMFVYYYAKKHANNPAFNFGTGKVHYLGGFASAIALIVVALFMALESIERLVNPEEIRFMEAIVVASIGLAVNIISAVILHDDHHHGHDHGHGHGHHHHHHHDHNLKAAYFHVLADVLTSVMAIVALIAGHYFGWARLDAIVGFIASVVICKWGIHLITEASPILLDKSPYDLNEIKNSLETDFEIVVKDLHIWTVAQNHLSAIVSVEAESSSAIETITKRLQELCPKLSHITVECV